MLQTFTSILTQSVIKAKGIKKIFSQDPIDYLALRKDDILQPKNSFIQQNSLVFTVEKTEITAISTKKDSKNLVIYIHGGAFVSGPCAHHWDSLAEIAKASQQTIWMCNYPKAPEHQIGEIMKNIEAVYEKALQQFDSQNITLMGDSAGGTISILLIQKLLEQNKSIPKQLIAISPVVDASLDHPEVLEIEKNDIMLSPKGVMSAKRMCLGSDELKNMIISPLHGNLKGFPKSTFFIASYDITSPDAMHFAQSLKANGCKVDVNIGEKMPHIWPLLPVMIDAKNARKKIIELLK